MDYFYYQPLMKLAAGYANRDEGLPSYLPNIFYAAEQPRGLELRFDPDTVKGAIQSARANKRELRSDDEIYNDLTAVVTRAITKALREHKDGDFLTSLIVDHLKTDVTRTDDPL